jgi:hypothetical protein
MPDEYEVLDTYEKEGCIIYYDLDEEQHTEVKDEEGRDS